MGYKLIEEIVMQYANIKNIRDIKHILDRSDVIKVNFKEDGVTNVDYVITAGDLFDDLYGKEVRGIMFDGETGKIISRPLHKFFNLGEGRCEVSLDEIKHIHDYRILDKLDGSMIAISLYNGDLLIKTRGTIHSNQAQDAKAWLIEKGLYKVLLDTMEEDTTYIFEWISPTNTVVVHYSEADLVLLAVRDNFTGKYFSRDYLKEFSIDTGMSLVKEREKVSLTNLMELMKVEKDSEGYVVVLDDGRMFKIKNDWYVSLHRVISYMRERDVVASILDGSIDDTKSKLAQNGYNLKYIEEIEEDVSKKIASLTESVYNELNGFDYDKKDFKTLAIGIKNKELLPLVMSVARGHELDVIEYYRKKHLKSHSLRTLPLIKGD